MKNSSRFIPLIVALFLVVGVGSFIAVQPPQQVQAQTGTFTFGVAGDYGSTSNTDGVLNVAKSSGINFLLGVGDLSYDTKGSPAGWGTYVKNIIGTLPFSIVMGNHDASKIDQFVAALPDPMTNTQGTYGKQYYFDYPATSPLARFIMISPVDGTKDLNWLNTSIDSARSSGIKWVVVGVHQPCVTAGVKGSCVLGQDVMDAITAKKVDVALFGHEHNYQRSKQVTCAKADTTDTTCIAAPGPSYIKGAGTVMVIVGSGGNGLYNINTGDPEAGYFAALNSDTYGFAKFTVSATELKEDFVKGAGGSFTDSFTISDSAGPSGSPSTGPLTSSAPVPSGSVGTTTPPFFPLAPCPTCTTQVYPTVNGGTTPPVGGVSVAPGVSSAVPVPSGDPCQNADASIASDNSRHHGHRHHKKHKRGGIGSSMDELLKFLIELINKLIEMLGGTPIAQPTDPADPADPVDPCDPLTVPSDVPVTSITPATSNVPVSIPQSTLAPVPSEVPSTQPSAVPSGV